MTGINTRALDRELKEPSTNDSSRRALWTREVRARLSSLRLSPTRETEIVDELSQHLEDRYGELIAGGASPEEASRLALASFRSGNILAQHLAALRQAHATAPITLGATSGHVLNDLPAGPALRRTRAAGSSPASRL